MTKVIHIKDAPKNWQSNPDYVYIGRPGKGLNGIFGNPHPVGFRCSTCNLSHAQGEAVEAFGETFERQILEDVQFYEAVLQLRGKILVCFCKSRERPSTPCHGDIYVAFLNAVEDGTIQV